METADYKLSHNEKLNNLNCPPNINVVPEKPNQYVWYRASIGNMKSVHRI